MLKLFTAATCHAAFRELLCSDKSRFTQLFSANVLEADWWTLRFKMI